METNTIVGLLSLAVDIMLQHRPKDEIKRRGSWTAKLRQAAEYAVEMTPPEQFSSSDDPNFSLKMRNRARDLVLPSLFDVAQSFEDYVFQYNLWEHEDISHLPKGKSINWQPIARPPRQTAQRKRARKGTGASTSKKESDIEIHVDASGDETEVDESMQMFANRQLRRLENATHKPHHRAALAVREDEAQQLRVKGAATPTAAPQQSFSTHTSQSTPNTSFNNSINRLHLTEDSKPDLVELRDQKEPIQHDAMPLDNAPQFHNNHHTGYANDSFHGMPNAGHYHHASQPPYPVYEAHEFVDPNSFTMFDTAYPLPMNHTTYPPPMSMPNSGFHYPRDGVFSHTSMDMSAMPTPVNTSFHGLPYDFELNGPGQGHGCCGTPLTTTPL